MVNILGCVDHIVYYNYYLQMTMDMFLWNVFHKYRQWIIFNHCDDSLSLLFSILSLKCRGIYLTICMVKLFLKMVPRNWQDISTILGIFLMVFVVSQASLILHSCFLYLSSVSISDLLGCCGLLSFMNFEKFCIIIFFKKIYLFIFGGIESSLLCVDFL